METVVKELPESRVRIEVVVPPDEVETRFDRAAGRLGREVRIPGFRPGKVPTRIVVQRVGRQAVMDEAIRDAFPEWVDRALSLTDVVPIGQPGVDMVGIPENGGPFHFSVEAAVVPKAQLGQYKGLEVGRRTPDVPTERVDAELERMRAESARLEPVERKVEQGDFVAIDYQGLVEGKSFAGSEGRDRLVEVGGDRIPKEFTEGLIGMASGEKVRVEVDIAEQSLPSNVVDKRAVFDLEVKGVHRPELPELDDAFAVKAAGVDSLAELRSEIEKKLAEAERLEIDSEFREAAVDSAASQSHIDLPESLVRARAREMWESFERSLERRGRDAAEFLAAAGMDKDGFSETLVPRADRDLRREAVLEAVAQAEEFVVDDEALVDQLMEIAGEKMDRESALQALDRLKARGDDRTLVREVRKKRAARTIVDSAVPISVDLAQARDKLWTPGVDRADDPAHPEGTDEGVPSESGDPLWTP